MNPEQKTLIGNCKQYRTPDCAWIRKFNEKTKKLEHFCSHHNTWCAETGYPCPATEMALQGVKRVQR